MLTYKIEKHFKRFLFWIVLIHVGRFNSLRLGILEKYEILIKITIKLNKQKKEAISR